MSGSESRLSKRAARRSSWLTKTSVLPCSRVAPSSRSMKPSRSAASSAEVGSSAITSSGAPISARAAATRCCWPTDSAAAGRRHSAAGRATRCSRRSALPAGARLRRSAEKRQGSSTLSSTLRYGSRLNCWKM